METMLRFRVAKQRNQTNSNLLGMVLALLLPRRIQSVVGRAPGPLFFGWARPESSKLQARKLSSLDRSQAVGYYKILKTKGKLC